MLQLESKKEQANVFGGNSGWRWQPSVSLKEKTELNTLGFSLEGKSSVWPEDGTLLKQI